MTQIATRSDIHIKNATLDFGTRLERNFHQPATFDSEPAYSPDAIVALTPFASAVIQELYIEARRLAGPVFRSANVSWSNSEDGTDYRLDLVVRVDADWDQIDAWEYAILDKVTEWSESWSESQWGDYSDRIFHSLVPAHL